MSVALIQERLLSYQCQTLLEQENALKEIAQEIALMALSRSDFFRIASFQGGTCLRILYGLERFSEDLDFILRKPNKSFTWDPYIKNMQEEFSAYGYRLEAKDKTKLDKAIKTAFLKADSEGALLILQDLRTNRPKLQIKLEIDSNPPEGSAYKLKYLDFPLVHSVQTQDLASLFAGKIHALLCREYIKGRDWYDFSWYIARKTPINFVFLENALRQSGHLQDQDLKISVEWLLEALKTKIHSLDWNQAKQDIARFLRMREASTLEFWSLDFFMSRLEKLAAYLNQLPSS